ncbi:MAG TPA: hypothetical protein VH575_33110 [Gemmataceae bacterium]
MGKRKVRKRIDPGIFSLAGEFAVASELCRRNIYTQLTLGNLKKTDLLTLSGIDKFNKIEVKTKQVNDWGNIKGLPPGGGFLVLVDIANRDDTDRPDFFILSPDDWYALAKCRIEAYKGKHPDQTPYLDNDNCPVFPQQISKKLESHKAGSRSKSMRSRRTREPGKK